ncbi:MAG: hypothetical protein HC767_14830 [Akkermansiaceae bacterium]|nr:hypothetical protein [Akkermansiaceae bacterium]
MQETEKPSSAAADQQQQGPGQVKHAEPQQQPDKPGSSSAASGAQADDEDIAAQRQLLQDIEEQCVSHGRHPGEWDNLLMQWVDAVRFRCQWPQSLSCVNPFIVYLMLVVRVYSLL